MFLRFLVPPKVRFSSGGGAVVSGGPGKEYFLRLPWLTLTLLDLLNVKMWLLSSFYHLFMILSSVYDFYVPGSFSVTKYKSKTILKRKLVF